MTFDIDQFSPFTVLFPLGHVLAYSTRLQARPSLASLPSSGAGDGRPRHHDHQCGVVIIVVIIVVVIIVVVIIVVVIIVVVIIVVVIIVVVVVVTAVFVVPFLLWRAARSANRRRCKSNGGAGMASKEKRRGSKEGNMAFDARLLHLHHVSGTQFQCHKAGACHRVKQCVRENQCSWLRQAISWHGEEACCRLLYVATPRVISVCR